MPLTRDTSPVTQAPEAASAGVAAGHGVTLNGEIPNAVLDLYRQSHTRGHLRSGWPPCPAKRGLLLVESGTGRVATARCDRLKCHSCVVPNAIHTAEAIAWAKPKQWVTLTRVGDCWQSARTRLTRWHQQLKRWGISGEFAYHVELNPAGDGQHAHVWWRGDPLDSRTVTRANQGAYAAAGDVSISDSYRVPTLEYGMKAVLWDRPAVPEAMWSSAASFLEANGGRLVHKSGGYFRDERGRTLGVREARRRARAGVPRHWDLVGTLARR